MSQNVNNIKDKFIKNSVSNFFKEISNNKIYNSNNKTLTLTTCPKNLPIIVKTHHKTKNDIVNFVRKLDEEFSHFDVNSDNNVCGV